MGNHLDKINCYKSGGKKVPSLACIKHKVKTTAVKTVIHPERTVDAPVGDGGKGIGDTGRGGEGGGGGGGGGDGGHNIMKLPIELEQLIQSGLFSDRDRVVRIIRKFREMMSDEDTIRYYEERHLDPTKPDVLLNLKRTMIALDRQILSELGLDSYVKDWTHFPGLLPPIFALYFKDIEVVQEIEHITTVPRPDILKQGVKAPDVGVISMETGETLALSSFHAVIMGGTLSELFRDFHEQADFVCVYIAEAHAKDRWNLGTMFSTMSQHHTLDQRMDAARELLSRDAEHHHALTDNLMDRTRVPLVLDSMEDTFNNTYNAHPDRAYVIEGGVLVYLGDNVMKQHRDPERFMTHELRDWFELRFRDHQ